MALQITRRAKGWDGNIAGSNTVELSMPIGLSYHQTTIEYDFENAAAANIPLADAVAEVRLVINGKPQWACQASEIDRINRYAGRVAADNINGGILVLDYDRYGLRNRGMEEFTVIGTGHPEDDTPITTLTIEMDLKAGVSTGTLASRHIVSAAQPVGVIKKLRRYVDTFTGAGEYEIDDLPKGDAINAVYFFASADVIDNVRLERDDFILFDRSKKLNNRLQSDGKRSPQTSVYVVDWTEKGNGQDQLLTRNPDGTRVNDLRFFIKLSAAATIHTIVEYMGGLEI